MWIIAILLEDAMILQQVAGMTVVRGLALLFSAVKLRNNRK
jgi:hypothetical protein